MLKPLMLLLGLAATPILACNRDIRFGDVLGSYALNKGDAIDVVELRADSTYSHEITPRAGSANVERGAWTLEDRRIIFTDFLMRAPKEGEGGTPQVRGIWPASVDRDMRGRLRLVVNDDLGWYYVRK